MSARPLSRIAFVLNGAGVAVDAAADDTLLDVLRDTLGHKGTRYGCGSEQCGACLVHVDGRAVASCTLAVDGVRARSVTTVEGLGTPEAPHPLQQAFLDEQAAQCGYCTSGMLMAAAALLARDPAPDVGAVKAALDGQLCRCGSHPRIVRAVLRAARSLATDGSAR